MIPKIKKILYATDLSASASHAFGYALSQAVAHNAKISIINVYEQPAHGVNFQQRSVDLDAAKERLTEVVRERLGLFFQKEDPTVCQYTKYVENIYVCDGSPVTTILEHARKGGYDLIVMGTHGHGFLYNTLIGSNAQKMVQESEIPVLVVRINGKEK